MIDCSKPVKYKVIVSSSYVDTGYKRYTTNSEDWITCKIESIKGTLYGRVKTDVKVWKDFKPRYFTGYEETGNEQSLYDLVDLKTGYVVAKKKKNDHKEAIAMLEDFEYQNDGIYKAKSWNAVITSKLRYYNL